MHMYRNCQIPFQKFVLIDTFIEVFSLPTSLPALDNMSLLNFANTMNKNDASYLGFEQVSPCLLAIYKSPSVHCLFTYFVCFYIGLFVLYIGVFFNVLGIYIYIYI